YFECRTRRKIRCNLRTDSARKRMAAVYRKFHDRTRIVKFAAFELCQGVGHWQIEKLYDKTARSVEANKRSAIGDKGLDIFPALFTDPARWFRRIAFWIQAFFELTLPRRRQHENVFSKPVFADICV